MQVWGPARRPPALRLLPVSFVQAFTNISFFAFFAPFEAAISAVVEPGGLVSAALVGLVVGALSVWVWSRARGLFAREGTHIARDALPIVLNQTDALLWEADVERDKDGELRWSIRMGESLLSRRLFPRVTEEDSDSHRVRLWREHAVPEMAEMNRRAGDAIAEGKSGYRQEFRVLSPSGTVWLREAVSIQYLNDRQIRCVGIVVDITDVRDAERARRASERALTEILTRADVLLWRSHVRLEDGEYRWLGFEMPRSALFSKLFGDREVGTGGKLWSRIDTPQLAEMNQRHRVALRENAKSYEQEFPAINDAGQKFWLQEQVSIHQERPDEWHLVGVITDITERRKAEQAVRVSETRFRNVVQHMPVPMVEADFTAVGEWLDELRARGVQDLDTYLAENPREVSRGALRVRITAVNHTARETIGARDNREIRWRRRLMDTPSSVEAVRQTFLQLWEGRNFLEREVELKRFDGAPVSTTMRWWVAQSEQGLHLNQAILIFVDVTELKKVQADLAAQREQLVVTLRAMKEGVIATDLLGRVRFINPAAQELIGKFETAAIGQPLLRACGFVSDKTLEPLSIPIEQVAAGGTILDLPEDTAIERGDGEVRLIEGQFAPVHNAASQVTGTVLVFRDITDRDRLEKEMVRATRLESVGVLAGGIAHDFNNILTTVIGNLSIAQLDAEAEGSLAEAVRDAERAALKAKDLTQQLLTFAKGGEPVREAVHLEQVLREMTQFALHGSNVRAEFSLAPDLWMADADKGQVGRVIQNLVLNAAQAMPEGGRVRVEADNETLTAGESVTLPPGDYIRIKVVDTGMGIKADHVGRIFDPYFSTKQAGSGLGLSAVYSIVQKHQGDIDVVSELGVGTTFTVWLPVARGARSMQEDDEEIYGVPLQGRVLFMDDEEPIRAMIRNLLRRLGLEVETTADGEELIAAYRRDLANGTKPDLVITDLTVPGGMGGKAAMQELLRIDPQVRAIVSSGYSSDPIMSNYREHGFCGMVAKPYKLPELRRVLHQALAPEPGGDAGEP